MTEENKHSPQHKEILEKQALEQQEVKEVLTFLQKYAKQGGIAFIILALAFSGYSYVKNKKLQNIQEANILLLQAANTEEYQKIITDYSSTPVSKTAELLIAADEFSKGNIANAKESYQRLSESPDKNIALTASFNLIACLENEGQFEEAANKYGQFAETKKESYLYNAALMAKARCLTELSKNDEARIIYEDIMANEEAELWHNVAENNLKTL